MGYYATFFHILSCAINDTEINWGLFKSFTNEDWERLYALSKEQGVVAIIIDRLRNIPQSIAPQKSLSLKWISHSLSIENQMRAKENIAIDFADKLSERGIDIAILKGLVYASYYPNPYHRESGDLDCYMMGKKDEGDKITVELGGKMQEAGPLHSQLFYKALTIENHRYLTSYDKSKLSVKTETLLQNLIKTDCKPIGQTKLLTPCADFNALFLIKHAQRHFIKEGIYVRHLLDWAFFLKAESANVNWIKVIPIMEECKMLNFAKVLTRICIEKFNLRIDITGLNGSQNIVDTVLVDILSKKPDILNENLGQKIKRIFRRFYRMWKFRTLAYKSYIRLVCESLTTSIYLQEMFKL